MKYNYALSLVIYICLTLLLPVTSLSLPTSIRSALAKNGISNSDIEKIAERIDLSEEQFDEQRITGLVEWFHSKGITNVGSILASHPKLLR